MVIISGNLYIVVSLIATSTYIVKDPAYSLDRGQEYVFDEDLYSPNECQWICPD